MPNNITKNFYPDSLHIWLLKFNILSSLIQLNLKNSLIVLFRFNMLTLGISLFGLTYYISFFDMDLKSKKFANFIHKNVPGVYLTSTTISWQTFQKTLFLPSLPINQASETSSIKSISSLSTHILENQFLNAATDSICYWGDHLQLKLNSQWNSYKKQYFLGVKKPPKKQKTIKSKSDFIFYARDNLTSSYYECVLTSESKTKIQVNPFQKTFYQLDEFPLNLQQIQFSDNLNKLRLQVPTPLELNPQLAVTENKQFTNNQMTFSTQNLDGQLTAIHNFKSVVDQSSTKFFNLISVDKTYLKWQALRSQINQFFYQKNYFGSLGQFNSTVNQSAFNQILKDSKFSNISSSQVLFILNKLESTNKLLFAFPNKSIFVIGREMSGFTYPDTTTEHIYGLYQKLKYYTKFPQFHFFGEIQNHSYIDVQLGVHFSSPVNHSSSSTVPEKLLFKYTPIKLDAMDGNLYYSGPGILTDSNKLDKVTYNFPTAQLSLQEKLNSFDPREINLFRSFIKEPLNLKIVSSHRETLEGMPSSMFTQAKSKQYYQKFSSIKELSSERELTMNRFDFKSEYIVPQLPNSKTWFHKSTQPLLLQPRLINSFPVKQTSFIASPNSYTAFDILDYQNPVDSLRTRFWFKANRTSKLEFFQTVPKQSSLSTDLNRTTFESIGYFKKFQPYANPNVTSLGGLQKFNGLNKNQLYEPIHSKSWLMVNQYLLALFIFYILRQFTKEYGRELVSYLVDLISSLGILDESFKEELTGDASSSGYRVITDSQKRFKDIAGIEHIFSALSEVIWFLRNSGRSFNVSNILSKGILLVGPPGTGKTLLVQTIAGEAQVPVLVQSASALNSTDGFGAQRLQNLFDKAKQLAPCVIFFDEIDSIGERRQHIIDNNAQTSKLIKIISSNDHFEGMMSGSAIPLNSIQKKITTSSSKLTEIISEDQPNSGTSSEQLGLLMQLLIELDGLQSARRVIIIGATNRPNVLDPALTRPGRLDKVFQLGLPDKEKRIEICQLYSKILGFDTNIPWNYIGNKTIGLSGADLAAIVNQSAIQAILQKTQHTIGTLELAIDKITGDSTVTNRESIYKQISTGTNTFGLARSAYYYAGLAISQLILSELKTPILCSLFPIDKNERYIRMLNNLLQSKLVQTQRRELEAQLVAIYAGKVLEILSLGHMTRDLSMTFAQSDLGNNELNKGTNLIYLLVNRWFLYSPNQIHDQLFYFFENRNKDEVLEPNIYAFLNELLDSTTVNPIQAKKSKYQNFQRWTTKSWWQSQISHENTCFNTIYADWYRIYVTNPDENETNDEWISPDRYFHANQTYLLTRTINFNNFYKMRRDSTYQLVLEKAILNATSIFSKTKEFNDFFVMNLIQKDQLRQHEMDQLYARFMHIN